MALCTMGQERQMEHTANTLKQFKFSYNCINQQLTKEEKMEDANYLLYRHAELYDTVGVDFEKRLFPGYYAAGLFRKKEFFYWERKR